MGLGALLGVLASMFGFTGFVNDWVKPFGTIFINMLKLIAVPLILITLVKGISSLSDVTKLSRIGGRTLGAPVIGNRLDLLVGDREVLDADGQAAPLGELDLGTDVDLGGELERLVVGDAAGSVNPFNGEGIDYAYETARMAAQVLTEAIRNNDPTALQRYQTLIDDEFGQYFKVARLFARVIGRPTIMRELSRVGMNNRTLMEWVVRIMSNLLRPDEIGPAEAAYKAAAAIVRLAPNA